MQQSSDVDPEMNSRSSNMQDSTGKLSLISASKDSEFPMPPLSLAPSRQQEIRYPCVKRDMHFFLFFSHNVLVFCLCNMALNSLPWKTAVCYLC